MCMFTAQVNDSLMGDLPVQIAADGTISLRLGELLCAGRRADG